MKAVLQISLILNLALIGGLILSLTNQHKPAVVIPAPALVKVEPLAQPATSVPVNVPAAREMEAPPFHWSQLLRTKNYWNFVQNLRSSGCPETTVEDIVRGDTERAFTWERSQLALDGNKPGPWSFDSQMRMVDAFLGVTQAVEFATVPAPAGAVPLVLQNVDLKSLGLNAQQQQAVALITQQFIDAVGTSQNPNDPGYVERWQAAQPEADNMLRGMLGNSAYEQYFLAAQKTANGAAAGNP